MQKNGPIERITHGLAILGEGRQEEEGIPGEGRLLQRADEQEEEAEQDQQQVDDLALEVFLVEEEGTAEEGYDYAGAADHGDYGDHGGALGQGDEVGVIGQGQEDGYEDDGPLPLEGGSALPGGPPEGEQDDRHQGQLVEVAPGLHEHVVEAAQEVLVEQGADGSQQGGHDYAEHPFVVSETDTLLLAAHAEHVEGNHGNYHTYPLIQVQALAKQQQAAQQYDDGACRVYRPEQSNWQVLHAEIAENPGAQHDECLEHEQAVLLPAGCGDIKNTAVQQSCLG